MPVIHLQARKLQLKLVSVIMSVGQLGLLAMENK